jgi:hypothetical protein
VEKPFRTFDDGPDEDPLQALTTASTLGEEREQFAVAERLWGPFKRACVGVCVRAVHCTAL